MRQSPSNLTPQESLEVSVPEAASMLGVSARMLRLYIESRKIKALKVNRRWYVDTASLEAFRQRMHFPAASSQQPAASSQPEETLPDPRDKSTARKAVTKARGGLSDLACYRLCLEAFSMPLWAGEPSLIGERLVELKNQTLESLGAGYYSYGEQKLRHYSAARAALGAAIGLVLGVPSLKDTYRADISFLLDNCLPAFSALLKKLEKGSSHRKRATHA